MPLHPQLAKLFLVLHAAHCTDFQCVVASKKKRNISCADPTRPAFSPGLPFPSWVLLRRRRPHCVSSGCGNGAGGGPVEGLSELESELELSLAWGWPGWPGPGQLLRPPPACSSGQGCPGPGAGPGCCCKMILILQFWIAKHAMARARDLAGSISVAHAHGLTLDT